METLRYQLSSGILWVPSSRAQPFRLELRLHGEVLICNIEIESECLGHMNFPITIWCLPDYLDIYCISMYDFGYHCSYKSFVYDS